MFEENVLSLSPQADRFRRTADGFAARLAAVPPTGGTRPLPALPGPPGRWLPM